jgi:hypothetical protein
MTDEGSRSIHDNRRYCGGRGKRNISCRRPAGWGTDHVGQGRCKLHGGCVPVKHGRYSKIIRPTIQRRLAELEALEQDPLDLLPELNLLRALTRCDYVDFVDFYKKACMNNGRKPSSQGNLMDDCRSWKPHGGPPPRSICGICRTSPCARVRGVNMRILRTYWEKGSVA